MRKWRCDSSAGSIKENRARLPEDLGLYASLIRNRENIYLTNIPACILSGKEIALLYGARWEIELVFKELKSYYQMDKIPCGKPEIVECLIWVAILTLMCSRRILRLIRNANPENANRYTSLRWTKVFTEQADRLLTEVLECVGLKLDMLTLYSIYLDQGCECQTREADG